MAEDERRPTQTAPKSYSMPTDLIWLDFLQSMSWTDNDVLQRQPECNVFTAWVVYRIKREWGRA